MSNELHNTFRGIWRGIEGTPWYTWMIAVVLIAGIAFILWDSTR